MRRVQSRFDKSRIRAWWSDVLLKTAFDEIRADALIDTGSAHTVLPAAFLQELGLQEPAFDGPWVNSSLGSGRSAILSVNVGLADLKRSAQMDVFILESERSDFDFVLVGIDFLDQVGALLQFGAKREMAGIRQEPPEGVPVIEIPLPIFDEGFVRRE